MAVETPCTQGDPDDWFIEPTVGRRTPDGIRRRKALQACWSDCPRVARLMCLHLGMQEENLDNGIWGGYTEAQRREMATEIDRRRTLKEALEKGRADAAAGVD